MEDPFILTVDHKGQVQNFTAQLHLLGYAHKFEVLVNGDTFFFERDEEGNYRAILPPDPDQSRANLRIDTDLLEAISREIKVILS